MGRSRSFKAIREWAPDAEEIASPAPPSTLFRSSSFFWLLGLAIASFSAYELSEAPVVSVKSMWIDQLFSEYIPPGSVHLHLIRERNDWLIENDTEPPGLWDPPKSYGWKPCLDTSVNTLAKHRDQQRYLQVFCTGGLFQLHICVCNAVTVAWLLNASLVIPYFQESIVWKDPSVFEDIYDLDHFLSTIKKEVHVVYQLPPELSWSTPEYYERRCLERPNCFFFIPKHARKEWYFENLLPAFESHGVVVLDRYHHKLAFEGLPSEATQLRCKTNFYSLRFVRPIVDLARKLVKRLQLKAKLLQKDRGAKFFSPYVNGTQTLVNNLHGHFLGLHLRFEKDMIAHSACYYGGGLAERQALASYRRKTFKTFVPKAQFSAEYLRRNGSCPLTPEEVGLLLAGLGFKNVTPIYVAGKNSYGGEARIGCLGLHGSFTERCVFIQFCRKFPKCADWSKNLQRFIHKDRQGAPSPRKERYSSYRYPAPDCMCRELTKSSI
ncbi:hypothetical protein GOP47_0007578 [Adiantum capillus-veneris]|uniref:O-fucosyltransferase family protein n=1 Tax=Adiantum capillus-veneris TaxID=13818 RepID=A0A9D4ZJF5_ADICA|nr:hypothetical protein GOP47_0007578 [Adiantum capillus-veneris]